MMIAIKLASIHRLLKKLSNTLRLQKLLKPVRDGIGLSPPDTALSTLMKRAKLITHLEFSTYAFHLVCWTFEFEDIQD